MSLHKMPKLFKYHILRFEGKVRTKSKYTQSLSWLCQFTSYYPLTQICFREDIVMPMCMDVCIPATLWTLWSHRLLRMFNKLCMWVAQGERTTPIYFQGQDQRSLGHNWQSILISLPCKWKLHLHLFIVLEMAWK